MARRSEGYLTHPRRVRAPARGVQASVTIGVTSDGFISMADRKGTDRSGGFASTHPAGAALQSSVSQRCCRRGGSCSKDRGCRRSHQHGVRAAHR